MTSALHDRLQEFVGTSSGTVAVARDPVNAAMIRHWCDAMGDANPVYTDPEFAATTVHDGIVAPPAMLQAWTMSGLRPPPEPAADDPASGAAPTGYYDLLAEEGFTSVVATNCEQEYFRYLRPGDRLQVTSTVESISDEKTTALGTGHFITTLQEFTTGDGELVGTMRFRILRFRPPEKRDAPAGRRPRPMRNRDTQHWWEGIDEGELRLQRCASCAEMRHPPRPSCPRCHSLDWDTVVGSGRGEIHSFVVHHHPPVPGMDPPYAVALVALEEGQRVVGNVVGVEPAEVEIGMAVEVEFVAVDDELTLPMWRPAEAAR